MEHTHSDEEMMMATQIAYLDFDNNNGECNRNVQEIIDAFVSENCHYDGQGNLCLNDGVASDNHTRKQFEVVNNIINLENSSNGRINLDSWTVKDVCNDESKTGYVGMLIDTGDGNAIIGNRGSESYNGEQTRKDWIEADLGLLDSSLTGQQDRAAKYMNELWYKYGDNYDKFSVAGHSLGGNLSQHMTVFAPAAMRIKLDHTINFDGPGFSDEYIRLNADRISDTCVIMDRYQWSWVSSLLIPLTGVADHIVRAHDEEGMGFPKGALFRHDTHNVEFDEFGNVQVGDESSLSAILGPVSRYIEGAGDNSIQDLMAILGTGGDTYEWKGFSFSFISAVYGVKLIMEATREFKAAVAEINTIISNIYYGFIAPQVSGVYEVNIAEMKTAKEAMLKDVNSINQLNNEIEGIRKQIRYDSAASSYYKSRLATIQWGLERKIKELTKLINKIDTYSDMYSDTDKRVAELFCLT